VSAKVRCTDSTCKTVILDPDVRLERYNKYTARIEGAADTDGLAIEDLQGNELAQDYVKTFKTGAR
jgi:hypothetical protein